MTQMPEVLTVWHGRKWDAPLTDDALEFPEETARLVFDGRTSCDHCGEPMVYGENILLLPHIHGHLECHLRSMLGDVAHLEGRCTCNGPGHPEPGEDAQTYRQASLAAVQWLVDRGQGRFCD